MIQLCNFISSIDALQASSSIQLVGVVCKVKNIHLRVAESYKHENTGLDYSNEIPKVVNTAGFVSSRRYFHRPRHVFGEEGTWCLYRLWELTSKNASIPRSWTKVSAQCMQYGIRKKKRYIGSKWPFLELL